MPTYVILYSLFLTTCINLWVLADGMALMLDKIISHKQSTFIKGCRLVDGGDDC